MKIITMFKLILSVILIVLVIWAVVLIKNNISNYKEEQLNKKIKDVIEERRYIQNKIKKINEIIERRKNN